MTNNVSHPAANPGSQNQNNAKPDPKDLPHAESGAHEKDKDEEIKSRSADPGQSSYGGFSNEDTRRQAQDLEGKGDKK